MKAGRPPALRWVAEVMIASALVATIVLAGTVDALRGFLALLEPRMAAGLVLAALLARAVASSRRLSAARSVRRGGRRLGRVLARYGWAPAVLVWLLPLWSQWDGRPPDHLSAWQSPLGFIPWSDGYAYFEGAHELLGNGRFGSFAEQKPLFPALLAVSLRAAGGSLADVLAARSVFLGLCAFAAARAIGIRYGTWCAVAAFGVLLGLGRGVSTAVVTEPLGIALGALSLAVFASHGARKSPGRAAAGLFLLAVALQVRPGVQFVLPALLAWMVLHFRLRRGRALAYGAVALLVPTLVTPVLNRAYGAGESSFLARPAFFLYGLVHGSSETQAAQDHAHRRDEFATEESFARFVYGEAWAEFRRHPGVLFRSMADGISHFVEKNFKALAAPLDPLRPPVVEAGVGQRRSAGLGIFVLTVLGALSLRALRAAGDRGPWLALAAGSLASGAFMGGENPVHGAAAVHPFLAFFVARGLATPRAPRRVLPGTEAAVAEGRLARASLGATFVLLLVALLGPDWARRSWPRPDAAQLMGMVPGRDMVIAREASPMVAVGDGGLPFRRYITLLDLSNVHIDGVQPPAPFVVLSAWDFVGRRQRVLYAPIGVADAHGFLHLQVEDEQRAPNGQPVVRAGSWRPLAPWTRRARPSARHGDGRDGPL